MKRTIILILDSFGIGASQDAVAYGDAGADTLGHIAQACARNEADVAGLRAGPLLLPNLCALGLQTAALASTGLHHPGLAKLSATQGLYGYAVEQSRGKDTPSGHWEMMGVPVLFDWGYFPPDYPSFPAKLVDELVARGQLTGVLGNKHASGTEIIAELGEQHLSSGQPIVYTSADSVFQIAAHEEAFGLQRLYDLCLIARELVDEYNIARVIARPFVGTVGNFQRTGNRRDYSLPPPAPTLLNQLQNAGGEVIAIGKIADIFAGSGISQTVKADSNMALFDATLTALQQAGDKSLIFTNFVDFDSKYGHRRDIAGYAAALEAFDARLPELQQLLQPGDLVIISADHGCDPSQAGSDHTREHVPVLAFGPGIGPEFIGRRESFADIGQSIAVHMGLEALDYGISFI